MNVAYISEVVGMRTNQVNIDTIWFGFIKQNISHKILHNWYQVSDLVSRALNQLEILFEIVWIKLFWKCLSEFINAATIQVLFSTVLWREMKRCNPVAKIRRGISKQRCNSWKGTNSVQAVWFCERIGTDKEDIHFALVYIFVLDF